MPPPIDDDEDAILTTDLAPADGEKDKARLVMCGSKKGKIQYGRKSEERQIGNGARGG